MNDKQAIPNNARVALAAATRSPGWNSRSATVQRFDLGHCALFVVPARCWAYRRREQQTAAWWREHGYG